MPKVTRRSAAANERPSRKARPVFGDVSNNSKSQQSNATKTKAVPTADTGNANAAINRRRSSRLSASTAEIDPAAAAALPASSNAPTSQTTGLEMTLPGDNNAKSSKSSDDDLIVRVTRRTRSKAGEDPPNHLTSEVAGKSTAGKQTAEEKALLPNGEQTSRATRGSKAKQSQAAPAKPSHSGLDRSGETTEQTAATTSASEATIASTFNLTSTVQYGFQRVCHRQA